jgi:hypothetical protein
MAEPYTYREVIEHALAQIEQRVYFADPADAPPRWVLALTPFMHRSLERNEHRRGVPIKRERAAKASRP